ncbi:MAG: bifunctional ADP-heptose synthase [Bacteroidales bacterium]|nr:bifunctional ADP-heptose synthase [Bacteroidales bacterium]
MKINKKELQAWEACIRGSNILVIGDVMMDSYIQGQVTRVSPEAPVPVVNIRERRMCMGGAANVAINLQSMGATPILCGVIGEDVKGYEFINRLEEHQMSTQGMLFVDDRPTTTKTRVIGNKMQIVRIDEEKDEAILEEETLKLYGLIASIIEKETIHAIIFEDYDKGCITPLLIEKVILLAKSKSIPVAVDPKKRNFSNYLGVNLFKPNLSELINGLDLDKNRMTFADMASYVEVFMQNNQHKMVLTTLSDKGLMVAYHDKSNYVSEWIPAHIRSIADVSGAGDTVISIATLAYIYGFPPKMIAQLSNIAGGLVCESVGVVPIDQRKFYEECMTLLG